MIKSTVKYEIFKKHENNREINKINLNRIVKSIQARNLLKLRPILVDSEYRVIDGNHRLEAAKTLNIEIYYQLAESAQKEDIILLNANQRTWRSDDYLNFYMNSGIEDYLKFFMLKQELDISTHLLVSMMMGLCRSGDHYLDFKIGKFKYPAEEEIEKIRKNFIKINELKKFTHQKSLGPKNFLNTSRFDIALHEFLSNQAVNMDIFIKKYQMRIDLLRPCATREQYHEIFKAMYNWKNSHPII